MDVKKNAISLEEQVNQLKPVVLALKQAETLQDKLNVLNSLPIVQDYVKHSDSLSAKLKGINPEYEYVIKSIVAINQAPIVFNMGQAKDDKFERLRLLLQQLLDLDHFYDHLGGIVGYHFTVISMLVSHQSPPSLDQHKVRYIHPEGLHLHSLSSEVRQTIRSGIENLIKIAEIYPVGGAGDRLNLLDEKTGAPLPAAMLPFLGRNLLEGLIRDLQAREYLYFKLYGKQITTPIAMMTSWEKNNHAHILNICRQAKWFGRPPESFFLFIQPLIPVITVEGNWSLLGPLTLTLKPGGHGVIWKIAEDQGVFSWLLSQGRMKAIVRQINNPVAGTDFSLLSLSGLGCKDDKVFGFTSCERLLNSSEGVDVVIETQQPEGFEYCLTNIEYTDFNLKGINETPAQPGSPFSIYPTNTNILFVDIPTIQRILRYAPIPGQLINMKSRVPYIDAEGNMTQIDGGRLESTMQNIADSLVNKFPRRLSKEELRYALKTFILYNARSKTISTTKKSYKPGDSPHSTPEQSYYDIICNNLTLLRQECKFDTPDLESLEATVQHGPVGIFLYHPALGPLYSIIAQKIRKGRLATGAELQIDMAEVDIEHLELDGSCLIESTHPLGQSRGSDFIYYGNESRCTLQNVIIRNKGINRQAENCFWKNQIERKEVLHIVLHESSEFYAENVLFEGNLHFDVPSHHRLIVKQNSQGTLSQHLEKIHHASWQWQYQFDGEDRIKLTKKDL